MAIERERSIVWLRRDLRLDDHHAIYAAATRSREVVLAFVLDTELLRSPRMGAPIVQAFFDALRSLRGDLRAVGSDIVLLEGDARTELVQLARRIGADAVFYNRDYEPSAIARDRVVASALREAGVEVHVLLDHVYFGVKEVVQNDGTPYRVFTAYKRRWLDRRAVAPRLPFPSKAAVSQRLLSASKIGESREVPSPETYGYRSSNAYPRIGETLARARLGTFLRDEVAHYDRRRDFPALEATSCLSPQLRAGTIGIRTCVEGAYDFLRNADDAARKGVAMWVSELIWRDFYQMVLATWPHVAEHPFVEAAKKIMWRESECDFAAWCDALTGIPIVDAAMRQLNTTGWMHNRLRMIVASFFTKDLLLDWRLGERYFERHLADADLAQNNGGWQWTASTGTDAAPYFRLFNPIVQSQRFDPDGAFIRAMLPELARLPTAHVHAPWEMPPLVAREVGFRIGLDYPPPIVEHAAARLRALEAFKLLTKARR